MNGPYLILSHCDHEGWSIHEQTYATDADARAALARIRVGYLGCANAWMVAQRVLMETTPETAWMEEDACAGA